MKNIAAITMARDDEFFLGRWIDYYGGIFGVENLFIYLDGIDQKAPAGAGRANITKLRHSKNMSRASGDKARIKLLSDLARNLFSRGYDIVIGTDSDEFLVVDPKTEKTLREYLSELNIKRSVGGLGLDVGQNPNAEPPLDKSRPFLEQRKFAVINPRYTKPVVLAQPAEWGSGFHRVKSCNFHIDKNLYLFHFGSVDLNMLEARMRARGKDWTKHLRRQQTRTIHKIGCAWKIWNERTMKIARVIQMILRNPLAWNKPQMLWLKPVVKIPKRFRKIV
ncbi:MAG: glycosyltransferase family 2 protein [Rickettsiales bacterium]|jgi:hypothetical protein|nr:glycosyltransferase family 2 protein [Rickettsiales bacterium]